MRGMLFTATAAAVALAAGPALAADKLSVGVGGYMQQWFGVSEADDTEGTVEGGVAQQSDSEIFFRGKLESDTGLTFSVKVELEGNNQKTAAGDDRGAVIDESQLTVSGAFGKITLGAEDPASTLTHHGGLDVGITLNCGDTHKWIGGLAGCSHDGFGTYGHGHGDKNQIMYFSPRRYGVQFGLSYIPDTGQEAERAALNENEKAAWAVGGNYVGEFGDGLSLEASLGHYQGSQVGVATDLKSGMNDDAITVGTYMTNQAAIEAYDMAKADGTTRAVLLQRLAEDAAVANKSNADAFDIKGMQKADDKTFSNAALQVGVGSFKFGIVYATNDGGAYMVGKRPIRVNANEGANPAAGCSGAVHCFDHDSDEETAPVPETVSENDPSNDVARTVLVKDSSKDFDTFGAGVTYSAGEIAVSLSHLATEWGDGGAQNATMLSLSYMLAPGIASKTSGFMATRDFADGREIEGGGLVTGIALSF